MKVWQKLPETSAVLLAAEPELPCELEALAESEALAASIEDAVRKETLGGVANLSVEVSGHTIFLRGHCASFYCKQLAQQAAMTLLADARLSNHIRVR